MSRLLCLSDLHGRLESVSDIYQAHRPDFIIHTGNFGFWNASTLDHELAYLKQIVAFLEVLPAQLVSQLNGLSTISSLLQKEAENDAFRALLGASPLSQLDAYLSGEKTLPCAVYTVFGPLDDPYIVSKFQNGEWKIPNLHLIDHNHSHYVRTPFSQPNVRIYGLGANVKVHSLFDNGSVVLGSVSGKVGDLWVTLGQIAEMYLDLERARNSKKEPASSHISSSTTSENPGTASKGQNEPASEEDLRATSPTINIFVSHAPVVKTPLLEHLAIVTKADFTVSQGLHFRYPVMGNGMSLVDSIGGSAGYIETYRLKFLRLRMILGELWLLIKSDVLDLLIEESADVGRLLEVGLNLFDKIPVPVADSIDKIVLLSLRDENDKNEDVVASKKILAQINDHYFAAYYNLWHFNLCDHIIRGSGAENEYNVMLFKLENLGNFRLEYCNSLGFNFTQRLRKQRESEPEGPDRHILDEAEGVGEEKMQNVGNSAKSGVKGDLEEVNTTFESEEGEEQGNTGSDDDSDALAKTREFINLTGKFYRGRGKGRGRGWGRGRGFLRGRGRGRE